MRSVKQTSLLWLAMCAAATTMSSVPAQAADVLVAAADCNLDCHNGAECYAGEADFSDQPKDVDGNPFFFNSNLSHKGHYCKCPEGFTGLHCNRPMQVCDDSHVCYHGGQCIIGMPEAGIEIQERFCDCSGAKYDGKPYAGKYCEHEGAVMCNVEDPTDTEFFCVNGGTCKDGYETKDHPCHCQNKHRGPHCEFDHGHVPECNLTCRNGGGCRLGYKTYEKALYDDYWVDNEGFMYCDCPDGYFGNKCEVEGKKCGPEQFCFNGASCLETMNAAGNAQYACDCRTAHAEGHAFSGSYCQAQVTTFCSDSDSNNGKLYCANGGTCKDDPSKGCNCQNEYHGESCEHHKGEEAPTCGLTCQNDGKCRKGFKDVSLVQKFGKELKDFNATHDGNWEHCVCPDGFFGVECEHKLQVCPGAEHVCLHGSKCVSENENTADASHKCDCDAGFDSIDKSAGKFCQYTSTDICTKDGKPGTGKASYAFCVNGGTCKEQVADNEDHPGCHCGHGFVGDHCEFLKESQVDDAPNGSPTDTTTTTSSSSKESGSQSSGKKKSNSGVLVTLGLATLVALGAMGAFVMKRKKAEAQKDISDIVDGESHADTENYSEQAGSMPMGTEDKFVSQDPCPPSKTMDTMDTVEIM